MDKPLFFRYDKAKEGGKMELYEKLRAARAQAGLTQEQAAEALLVSRQTVSNWETGKTYPDIVSVVKMSDLYGVSLDALLKEKEEVSDYVRYLGESCDRVKSGRRLRFCILAAVYFLVWAAAPVTFWGFTGATDAMGFSLLFFYLLFPLAHISSFSISCSRSPTSRSRQFWGRTIRSGGGSGSFRSHSGRRRCSPTM